MALQAAVIGVGYLGKFHAQKYAALPDAELVAVCDTDLERAKEIADANSTENFKTEAVTDYESLVDKVDCVSIVTPTCTHYKIAKFFLEHGVHVMLEKPITVTLQEADRLIEIGKAKNAILQIGHLERFNPAIEAIRPSLTDPRFIEAVRISSFNPRGIDVNVVLDLMIHDLDLILSLVNSDIASIQANGAPVLTSRMDIVNARVTFENGCVANLTSSRISFRQERKLRIFQPSNYISINLEEKSIAHFWKNDVVRDNGFPSIESDMKKFPNSDAILAEIQAFLHSILNNEPAKVSGEDGRRALAAAIQINDILAESMQGMFEHV